MGYQYKSWGLRLGMAGVFLVGASVASLQGEPQVLGVALGTDSIKEKEVSLKESALSPLVWAQNEELLFVGAQGQNSLFLVEKATGKTRVQWRLEAMPQGLVLGKEGAVYVALGGVRGRLERWNLVTGQREASVALGHTPMSPVLDEKGEFIYVVNRFSQTLCQLEAKSLKKVAEWPTLREPIAVGLSEGGKKRWVAHHLPTQSSDGDFVAASLSLFELGKKRADFLLPNGAQGVRGLALSPDGQWVFVTHVLSHYQVITSQLARGWMNTNALSFFSTQDPKETYTVLLDDVNEGAANPWAVALRAGGEEIWVSHAGTHEVSVIDFPALLEKIKASAAKERSVTQRLGFLEGVRQRFRLPLNGARSLVLDDKKAYVAGYFSDSLVSLDLKEKTGVAKVLWRAQEGNLSAQREGERAFNDATLCFQQWQSCASCHPDARVDGLNWDLLNDGIGNPKNTRTMFLSHHAGPVMTLGVRAEASVAVKAGFKYIQFVEPTERVTETVGQYLQKMPQVPSPFLDAQKRESVKVEQESCLQCHRPDEPRGALTPAAQRGKKLFASQGCVECHPHPYFTNKKMYDMGTIRGEVDAGKKVLVPSLVEVWRTAPYLHDGRAKTLEEVFTLHYPKALKGKSKPLSRLQLSDLVEYVKSL